MLKKLKTRFILASMIALTILITILVGAINAFNYRSVIQSSDEIIELIVSNAGKLPSDDPDDIDPDLDLNFTPETPYESRYFTVAFAEGRDATVDTSSIAAVDDKEALNMALRAIDDDDDKGFFDKYRYIIKNNKDTTYVVFLDCTRSLDNARTFLLASISISLLGLAAVFLFLYIVAGKIVKPINDSYEKQRRFIADAGHDIKTPLTIIDADAELLNMEFGESEWLEDIKKQTSRLVGLTTDLIYLSKIDERESVPHTDFPLSEIIEDIVSSFNAPAKTKGITLQTNISPAIFYQGDSDSIKKLIIILIDNAIKYSPENNTVTVQMTRLLRNVIIKISNYAENLSDDITERMFDRFYRSDISRSTSGGFGIGLSVARAIVDSHKGKISAHLDKDLLTIEVVL